MSVWNDYKGKREGVHPALLPEVDESVSKLENFFKNPIFFKLVKGVVLFSALFFVSQVGFWLRYRVFSYQDKLPFPYKPHVQAYLDRQNIILNSYSYENNKGLFSVPIELAMKRLSESSSTVLLRPQFVHISDSALVVRDRSQ
jgi:hypothetical protein